MNDQHTTAALLAILSWMLLCPLAPAQAEAVDEALARAAAADEAGQSDRAAVALHAAAIAVERMPDGDERAARAAALAELATRVDPLLDERRRIESEAAAALVAVARTYTAAGRVQCAEFVLRDAELLEPSTDVDAVLREAAARAPDDKDVHDLLHRCVHPWLDAVMMGMRGSARDAALQQDSGWRLHLAAREQIATRLSALAAKHADAGRFLVAFELLRRAARIEPESTWPGAREIVADYRESIAEASEACFRELWSGSKRVGRWKKPRGTVLVPPQHDDEPRLVLAKQSLAVPFRIQADVSLEQQPAGGGLLVGGHGKEDYWAVEANTIGSGISVYVTRTVDGRREVVGGGCTSGSSRTPPAVRGAGEVLYNTLQLGMPVLLFVDVQDDALIVSGIMGEICRVDVEAGALDDGRYGFVRVPYSPNERDHEYDMTFGNLLITPGG